MNECKNCGRSCSGSLCEDCRRDARLDEQLRTEPTDGPEHESDYEIDPIDFDDEDPADRDFEYWDEQ